MDETLTISSIRFRNFKALRDYSVALRHVNVLVGPNNSGKSTIIGAIRALAAGLRKARVRSPEKLHAGSRGYRPGYDISATDVPISLENAHTDYTSAESTVTFRLSNGDNFVLHFPPNGGCHMFAESDKHAPVSPKDFRTRYPLKIGVIPVLGPVEHEEPLLQRNSVQAALSTHRASRHFRNYWLMRFGSSIAFYSRRSC